MSVPGAFAAAPGDSDSDSDASFNSGDLAHLEGIAQMDTDSDQDPDFSPAHEDDDDAFFIDDDDDDDEEGGEDEAGADADVHRSDDGEDADAGVGDDRPQLRIGLNPVTRSVMLIGDDGAARPLTAADLAGTSVSLGAIRNMLMRSIGRRTGAGRYDAEEDDEMDEGPEDDDDEDYGSTRARQFYPIIEGPQENGMRLERGGAFGPPSRKYVTTKARNWTGSPTVPDYLRARELDFRRPFKDTLGDLTIPNSVGVEVAQFTDPVYSGQYSSDGRFFYAACKDYRVYMYDTSTAPRVGDKSVTDQAEPGARALGRFWSHRTSLKVQKIAQGSAANCSWTLTDAELSDDNQWLIYSSITPRVHMVRTGQGSEWETDDHEQHTLDFAAGAHYGFGIWSVRFSHDAREVVAGARSGLVLVYDVEAQRTTLRVRAHADDTNAVAFASASDSNLLVSGSDDCFVKVWDRRSLDGERPSGTCVGHTEGVTFVAPKGDGRYILSNGKDQGMKLWDLRMMMGEHEFERLRLDRKNFSNGFDYRHGYYEKPRFIKHPHDVSVMTYRGHAVLRTLIRCHFSPLATTGQRYVYSGSSDGRIHIYSLDGQIAQVLDRAHSHPLIDRATGAYADPSDLRLRSHPRKGRAGYMPSTVRDVSWHPYQPQMMSTAWEDRGSVEGSIALHEWAGKGELLEDQVERAAWEARG